MSKLTFLEAGLDLMARKFEIVDSKFRKHPEQTVTLPKRADQGACAYDFYSLEEAVIAPHEKHLFWTDVKAHMYIDNYLAINTRSGNGVKYGIVLANSIGFIDASYYGNENNDGNIGICLLNEGDEPFEVHIGDRIAQGCFNKYWTTVDDPYNINGLNEIGETRRGGFGSTGK